MILVLVARFFLFRKLPKIGGKYFLTAEVDLCFTEFEYFLSHPVKIIWIFRNPNFNGAFHPERLIGLFVVGETPNDQRLVGTVLLTNEDFKSFHSIGGVLKKKKRMCKAFS